MRMILAALIALVAGCVGGDDEPDPTPACSADLACDGRLYCDDGGCCTCRGVDGDTYCLAPDATPDACDL